MAEITIAGRKVGDGHPCYIIAEIGINHNGDLFKAIDLIKVAKEAGCEVVKFQKRTVRLCYTPEELEAKRVSPWGTTNLDQKLGLELNKNQYIEIDRVCKDLGIGWAASPWDQPSVDFLEEFDVPFYKVASARVRGDDLLLEYIKQTKRPVIMSTGAANEAHIRHAVSVVGEENLILTHCVLQYPCPVEDLNLSMIQTLRGWFPKVPIGYSGHEKEVSPSVMAAVLGACVVERHITLDCGMYGSDQQASLEPEGLKELVQTIRMWERARGDGQRQITLDEEKNYQKLRTKDFPPED